MDWGSLISTVAGAVIGAIASLGGSYVAQNRAGNDARQARLDERNTAAYTDLSRIFVALRTFVRGVPAERSRTLSQEEWKKKREEEVAWNLQFQAIADPVRVVIESLSDRQLRERLRDTIELLEGWDMELEYAYHGVGRRWVLQGLVDDAVACLGAWRRDEALPEPNRWSQSARESFELKHEEWDAAAVADAESRNAERKRNQQS